MDIRQIANTLIRGEKTISFPLKYDDGSQTIFDAKNNMLFQIRGWGRLQYHSEGQEAAAKLQDEIGQWVVETLNAEWEGATTVIQTCAECGDPFPKGSMIRMTDKGLVGYEHFSRLA